MLSIRPARLSEAQRLAEIGLAAWEVAIAAWGEDRDRLRPNAEKAYSTFCANSWPAIIVAEWDGVPVGWAACEDADETISDLWVLPEFQGRGIGTRLLGRMEADIGARGLTCARVATHARNAGAIRLYKELGYHVRSFATTYDASLDTDIDKVELIKYFDGAEALAVDHDDGLYGF